MTSVIFLWLVWCLLLLGGVVGLLVELLVGLLVGLLVAIGREVEEEAEDLLGVEDESGWILLLRGGLVGLLGRLTTSVLSSSIRCCGGTSGGTGCDAAVVAVVAVVPVCCVEPMSKEFKEVALSFVDEGPSLGIRINKMKETHMQNAVHILYTDLRRTAFPSLPLIFHRRILRIGKAGVVIFLLPPFLERS